MKPLSVKVSQSHSVGLLAHSLRGARFGAKFTFWFLTIVVSLPIVSGMALNVAMRPWTWRYVVTGEGLIRYVIPAFGVPPAGAIIGAVVAAVLLPAASLLNGRSSSGQWEGYEAPASPFDDIPQTPRSREELLRRIVLHASADLAEQS